MKGLKAQKIKDWNKRLGNDFWRYPNRLVAIRATVAMAIVSVPFVVMNKPFYGVSLALGALAGALAETDDHPKGRVKSLSLTILTFFVSSFSVGVLFERPWLLGAGFIASTILFILIGGISERYRAITFGAILVGIYAMLGISISPAWYWQAVLLPTGALVHGIISLILLSQKPWRPLDEQMARGFRALSAYLEAKAKLFPSTEKDQEAIRNQLAILNIGVVNSLEKIKEVLNSYDQELHDPEMLKPYLQRFMLLQSMHERAASSHERYEMLSAGKDSREVLEGIGEMLRQLSYACTQVAENFLTGTPYHHPLVMDWIAKAIAAKLHAMDRMKAQSLVLLHHNLNRSIEALKYLDNPDKGAFIPRLSKDRRTLWERMKAQFTFKHPRMRYAIRIGISFLIGYTLVHALDLEKGAWIMLTSLFVSQITYRETRQRLFQRILGTFTGVILGVLLIQIFPTKAGQLILMLAAAMAFFYWVRTKYSMAVVFITIFVISVFSLVATEGVNIIVPRLIYTLIGATLAFLVIRFLWPGWQHRRLPELFSQAMIRNSAYFKAIVQEYKESNPDDLSYRIARRKAHLLDNELAMAGQSMRVEPKNKRTLMPNTYKLIYLNHALLSYLSALGAHRDSYKLKFENVNNISQQIADSLLHSGDFLTHKKTKKPETDLFSLLVRLRNQIVVTNSVIEKQQLQLFYNITDVTVKISQELKNIKVAIESKSRQPVGNHVEK